MTYTQVTTPFGVMVVRDADGAVVPADPGNADYQAFLAAGAVAVPYVPPPAGVPVAVSPFQARKALRDAGLLDQVETAVAAAGGEVQIAWEYGLEVRRDSPMIAALADGLGLTAAQLDALFVTAGGL